MRRVLGVTVLGLSLALFAWALLGRDGEPAPETAPAPDADAPRVAERSAPRPAPEAAPAPEPPPSPPAAGPLPAPPAARPSPPEDERPLTAAEREDVRAALAALAPQVRQCFAQGYAVDPELEGTVEVEFTLAPAPGGGGAAREAALVASTLGAPIVEDCVRAKLARLAVGAMQGRHEVRVRHVFRLEADVEFGRPADAPYSP